jgi:hypothetical protein
MQRRVLRRFMELTLVVHACMAVAVLVDAVRNGRDKRWALATLVGGLLGAIPYLATDSIRSRFPRTTTDLDSDDLAYEDDADGPVEIDVADESGPA